MVINFMRVKAAKEEKQAYRQKLVTKILERCGEELKNNKSDFYLEHLRSGFPIHVLEGIAERLEVPSH